MEIDTHGEKAERDRETERDKGRCGRHRYRLINIDTIIWIETEADRKIRIQRQ